MRKLIKPAKRCPTCNGVIKFPEYDMFCDFCNSKISREKRFTITIFLKNSQTEDFEVCSWKCVFNFLTSSKILKKISSKNFNFISIPYISHVNIKEFYKVLKNTDFKKLIVLGELNR